MSKHTPGPWHLGFEEFDDWNHAITIVDDYDTPHDVFRGESGVSSEEAYANARLISAAPDLLAACKAIVACIEQVNDDHPTGLYLGSEYQQAVMAIAKAEGAA